MAMNVEHLEMQPMQHNNGEIEKGMASLSLEPMTMVQNHCIPTAVEHSMSPLVHNDSS